MNKIPTIKELQTSILGNLMSEFDVTLNPLGTAFLTALAIVLAGFLYLVYLAVALVQKNIWIDTCDYPTLLRYGKIILDRAPFPAGLGQYTLTVTGSVGATLPSTTVFKADDSSLSPGALFQITGTHVMGGVSDTITVNALAGGNTSRLNIGDTLTATAPMVNVNAHAVVGTEVVAPTDAETMEEYRTKCIEKIQLIPGGWSAIDYRLVGITIPGVKQTYAYATSGDSNKVDVHLQGEVDGTPIAGGIITNYQTALELVRPLTILAVNYYASTIRTIAVTVTSGGFPAFTTPQKTLINTAITNFVNNVRPYIAACDVLADRNDTVATFNLSAAITAAVPGYGFASVTFTVDGTPATDWVADQGEIPYFAGTAIFV